MRRERGDRLLIYILASRLSQFSISFSFFLSFSSYEEETRFFTDITVDSLEEVEEYLNDSTDGGEQERTGSSLDDPNSFRRTLYLTAEPDVELFMNFLVTH